METFERIIDKIVDMNDSVKHLRMKVGSMHCSSCARTIEKAVQKLDGVRKARLDFYTQILETDYEETRTSSQSIQNLIQSLGYTAAGSEAPQDVGAMERSRENVLLITAIALLTFIYAVLWLNSKMWIQPYPANILLMTSATVMQFWVGWRYYRSAWKAAFIARHANADTLIAMSTSAAYIFSVFQFMKFPARVSDFQSSTVVIALLTAGSYLKSSAVHKSSLALQGLISSNPRDVVVVRDGREELLNLEELKVHDVFIVKPGEKIAADGEVVGGHSNVLESMITGEPLPRPKSPGDTVISGTISQSGRLTVRATRVGAETTVARIRMLVEQASASKTRLQELGDRIAGAFVPAVLILSASSLILWIWIGGGYVKAIFSAVAVLIVACPCALTLAPGTAMAVSLGNAASRGILVKDVTSLEKAGSLKTIAFDKTGTLTQGAFRVLKVAVNGNMDEQELLRLAAGVEHYSEHPLAGALEQHALSLGLALSECSDFESLTGYGAKGTVDGRNVIIGRAELMARENIPIHTSDSGNNKTISYVSVDGRIAGRIEFEDSIKDGASEAVRKLKEMGIHTVLLTGDREEASKQVSYALGLEESYFGLAPSQKLELIKKWKDDGKEVAMVGDGINDSPSLAASFIGIAMGTGTDLAASSSDIVLLNGDPANLPYLCSLSKKTSRVLMQNFFWAFAFNVIALPLAAMGKLNPALGALSMTASSLIVISNSLRLRKVQ